MAAGVVALVIGLIVIRHAGRLGLIDIPNQRSSHVLPTPRGGGVGIAVATLGGIALLPLLSIALPLAAQIALLGGGLGVAAISLVDDCRGVHAVWRLAAHLAAGVGVVMALGPITAIDLGELTIPLGWAAAPLSVVWVAGAINAFNFMDGIDGIASAQAIVTATAWALIGLLAGHMELAACAFIIAGATAGFLVHNVPPARLFMGDVGSAFLGFMLAVLPLIAAPRVGPAAGTIGVVLLWPFIFDTALTLLRRAARGERLVAAHRSHYYQRLIVSGWTSGRTLALYVTLAVAAAAIGVALVAGIRSAPLAAAVVLPVMAAVVFGLVNSRERSPARVSAGGRA
jgi:Fuc2NAc and GlcNAc transferase